jgi:hypothetical protein
VDIFATSLAISLSLDMLTNKFYSVVNRLIPFLCTIFTDGNWADWSEWDSCSSTCGEGNQTRVRTCTNPVPHFGGKDCSDTNTETEIKPCSTDTCETIGLYSSPKSNVF